MARLIFTDLHYNKLRIYTGKYGRFLTYFAQCEGSMILIKCCKLRAILRQVIKSGENSQ